MDNLKRFPKGYLVRPSGTDPYAGGQEITDVVEDTITTNLWRVYSSTGGAWRKWSFSRAAVAHSAKVLGDFYGWLRLQYMENDCVYDTNLDFLEDTVQFILTGKRRMSLSNWAELLAEYPEAIAGIARPTRFAKISQIGAKAFDNAISDWCAHPEGFDDMMATMYLLFGTPRTVLDTPNKLPA